MKLFTRLKPKLKIILPLAIGLFLVLYSILSATSEERLKIWETIKNANYFWVSISLIFGFVSNYSRAARWKYMLVPLGCKPKLYNSFFAVMFGYLSNLGIPRSGEILRGATLATYENISFEKSFGTIVSERIVDFLMLLIIMGCSILLQAEEIILFISEHSLNVWTGLGVLLAFVFLFYLGILILRKLKLPIFKKLKVFLEGMWEGMLSIANMENKKMYLFHTFIIWGMYVAIFWVTKFSIEEVSSLGLGPILVAFIVGSFSISITSGGIGLYPMAIAYSLQLFDIEKESGEAFGWILWTSQTLLVIVLGVISAILLPVLNKHRN